MSKANLKPRKSRVWPVDVKIDVERHSHGVLDDEVNLFLNYFVLMKP